MDHDPPTDTAALRAGDTVVQYLYVHTPEERFTYPTSRSTGGSAGLAMRYLECALTQAASLRLRAEPREIVLVTNLRDLNDAAAVTPRGVRMLEAMESMGVRIVFAEYAHRNRLPVESYASSRYLLDAVNAVIDDSTDPDHRFWFTDLDCVWVDPDKVFAAAPEPGSVGCVHILYPPEWNIEGTTPARLGEYGRELGDCPVPVPWVGGELLCGTARDLHKMVTDCDELDERVGERGGEIPAEEHLLSLAGGLGGGLANPHRAAPRGAGSPRSGLAWAMAPAEREGPRLPPHRECRARRPRAAPAARLRGPGPGHEALQRGRRRADATGPRRRLARAAPSAPRAGGAYAGRRRLAGGYCRIRNVRRVYLRRRGKRFISRSSSPQAKRASRSCAPAGRKRLSGISGIVVSSRSSCSKPEK
jgi:hypothetical protein